MYPWLEALTFMSIGMLMPEPPQPRQADIVFAGDAMQHQAQIDAARRPDGTYDYTGYFDAVKPYIESADYAVVNLETPLGGKPYSGYPCFCAPDSYASQLRDAGFDLFLTANNHTLDRRDRGLKRTIATLDSLGVDHIGTYCHDSCRAQVIPMVRNINGFKIGFLNYTYGTNGITPGREVVVDYIDTLAIGHDIAATRRAGAEIVTVAIHWGDEYHLLPNTAQQRVARCLRRHGVEIVMGGHPHVIQPMELLTNPADSLDRRLTVYSLGNFISNMKTRDTRGGAMVKVTLSRDPSTGKAYVARASYLPVFTIPAQGHDNFRLVPANRPIDGRPECDTWRRQFLLSARAIFDKHNINVTEDTY